MNRPKVANLADYHQIQNGREVEIGFSLVALYASFTRAPKSVTDLMESKDMILELAPMTTAEIIADAHTDSDVVDKNLVWSEMTHVKMIWTYILNHFNEMSNMRTINDGDRALGNMVAFLDMHGSKAAYAKLFVP